MRNARIAAFSSLIGLVAAATIATPASSSSELTFIDQEEECLEPTPAAYALPGQTDIGVTLEVLILLDGVTIEDGEEVLKRAKDSYTPLGLELKPTYEVVDFRPETPSPDGPGSSSSDRFLIDAKDQTVGERPPDIDLVYVMTNKQISDAAGRADCIGGVRYPNLAYSVGEWHDEEVLSLGANFYVDRNAETLSHELGHLMGAHHHYANCGEGVGADDVANAEPAPCTLMFNFLDFTSINFSQLNSAIVLGHALEYAAETPSPQQVFERVLTFSLKGHLRAQGFVKTQGPGPCVANVPVDIVSRRGNGTWVPVETTETNHAGKYKVKIEDDGVEYRAQVPVVELDGGKAGYCRQSLSESIVHSH